MNRVVRRGVFETNSSSSHSITIAGGDFKPDHLPLDPDGRLSVFAGQFGWEIEDYYDAGVGAPSWQLRLSQSRRPMRGRRQHIS